LQTLKRNGRISCTRGRKRRRRLRPPVLILLIALGTLTVLGLCVGIHNLLSEKAPAEPVYPDAVYGVPVHTVLMPEELEARTGVKRTIRYIVVHETGNTAAGADAKSHSDYLTGGKGGETSWHYTVDDHEIYHHVPDDEVAWHAGDTKDPEGGNAHGIGIELCVNSDGNFEKTLDNGAKLVAYLLRAYHLDLDAVTQHADYMEKNCPQTLRDTGRWEEFLSTVEAYYKAHATDA
jgi:N-acetyl-anhydromuramyl-L-alanine amidase AmpD